MTLSDFVCKDVVGKGERTVSGYSGDHNVHGTLRRNQPDLRRAFRLRRHLWKRRRFLGSRPASGGPAGGNFKLPVSLTPASRLLRRILTCWLGRILTWHAAFPSFSVLLPRPVISLTRHLPFLFQTDIIAFKLKRWRISTGFPPALFNTMQKQQGERLL